MNSEPIANGTFEADLRPVASCSMVLEASLGQSGQTMVQVTSSSADTR